jgi:hypothetical protein
MLKSTLTLSAIALAATAAFASTPAEAGASGQHSAAASEHAGAASAHGSAAVGTGVSTAIAVPVIAAGSVLYVTGAALESVGDTVIGAGSDLANSSATPLIIDTHTAPNRAPALD